METLDKNFDPKVMMEFRKELYCKKCGLFPRHDVKLMLCGSCSELLCSKCCGTKCPLCQYESKNPKFPTFIQQSRLMKAILDSKLILAPMSKMVVMKKFLEIWMI